MRDSIIFKSNSQYATRFFYIPFILTGLSLGVLFVRFIIGHIYEFDYWIVRNIGLITIGVFLLELILLRLLGKYHKVSISENDNVLSIELLEDNTLVVRDVIEKITFFWEYFSKSPITEKEFKTDRGYLYQRLFCEIDTKEHGRFWLCQDLLFYQDAPPGWEYKQLEKDEDVTLYTCNNLKRLKNKLLE